MSSAIAQVDELLGARMAYGNVSLTHGCIPDEFVVDFSSSWSTVDTLIFDIDDTLYPVESGFTEYRNTTFIHQYMVDFMGFPDLEAAKTFRDEWFGRYHSTMKGFVKAAEAEKLPPMPDGSVRAFDKAHLIRHYAKACDESTGLKFLRPCVDPKFQRILQELRTSGIRLVIFTNGPRPYGLRVLETLGLRRFFDDENIFGVDTIAPLCKPEPESFLEVLRRVGAKSDRSVMFEDSLKNIRACKKLGMRTVLLTGRSPSSPAAKRAYASKGGDVPDESDPHVDYVLRTCADMRDRLPWLWRGAWKIRA